jgi:hypothetical protein
VIRGGRLERGRTQSQTLPRALLAAEELQELSSRAAAPVAGVREYVERTIGPLLLMAGLLQSLVVRGRRINAGPHVLPSRLRCWRTRRVGATGGR